MSANFNLKRKKKQRKNLKGKGTRCLLPKARELSKDLSIG